MALPFWSCYIARPNSQKDFQDRSRDESGFKARSGSINGPLGGLDEPLEKEIP